MTNIQAAPVLDWQKELTRARAHRDHGSDEFLSAIARIVDSGVSQVEVAVQVKASQPQVSRWAAKGRTLLERVDGPQLGRTPYHVAERFSRGEISREQVLRALTTWSYLDSETKTEGLHEDLLNYVPGSFDDVQAALLDDLIDDEIYSAALGALKAQTAARRQTSDG